MTMGDKKASSADLREVRKPPSRAPFRVGVVVGRLGYTASSSPRVLDTTQDTGCVK